MPARIPIMPNRPGRPRIAVYAPDGFRIAESLTQAARVYGVTWQAVRRAGDLINGVLKLRYEPKTKEEP